MNESLNDETLGAEPCFYYPIPGGLLDRDVIEIKGHFTGQSIIIAILVENKDDHALPLQLELTSQGVWSVNAYGASGHRDQQTGRTTPNTDFQIRIIAYQDKYQIYANSLLLCSQVHKIPLPEVTHLSIDGEAEFTGVEFKDLQSESEDYDMNSSSQMEPAEVKPGFIRLSETRQSSNRKPRAPQDIQYRSSFQIKNNLATQQLDNYHQLPTIVVAQPASAVHAGAPMEFNLTKEEKHLSSNSSFSHSSSSSSYSTPSLSKKAEGTFRSSSKQSNSKSMNSSMHYEKHTTAGDVWTEEGGREMNVDSRELIENHPPFIVSPSKSEPSLHQKDEKSKKGKLGSLFRGHSKKEKTSGNKKTHSRDSQPPEDSKTDTKKKHSFSLGKHSSKNKKPKEEKVKEEKSWKKKMGKLKHSKPKVNEQSFEQEAKVNISKPSAKIAMTMNTEEHHVNKAYSDNTHSSGNSSSSSSSSDRSMDRKKLNLAVAKGEFDLSTEQLNPYIKTGSVRRNSSHGDKRYSSNESLSHISINALSNSGIMYAANPDTSRVSHRSKLNEKHNGLSPAKGFKKSKNIKGDSPEIAAQLTGHHSIQSSALTSYTKATNISIPLNLIDGITVDESNSSRQTLSHSPIKDVLNNANVFAEPWDMEQAHRHSNSSTSNSKISNDNSLMNTNLNRQNSSDSSESFSLDKKSAIPISLNVQDNGASKSPGKGIHKGKHNTGHVKKHSKLNGDSAEIAAQLTSENKHNSEYCTSLTQNQNAINPLRLTADQTATLISLKDSSNAANVYASNPDMNHEYNPSNDNQSSNAHAHTHYPNNMNTFKGDSPEIAAKLHYKSQLSSSTTEDISFVDNAVNVPLKLEGSLLNTTSSIKTAFPLLSHNHGSYDVNNSFSTKSHNLKGEYKPIENDDWNMDPVIIAAPTITVQQNSAPNDFSTVVSHTGVASKEQLKGDASEIANNLIEKPGSHLDGQNANLFAQNCDNYPLKVTSETAMLFPASSVRTKRLDSNKSDENQSSSYKPRHLYGGGVAGYSMETEMPTMDSANAYEMAPQNSFSKEDLSTSVRQPEGRTMSVSNPSFVKSVTAGKKEKKLKKSKSVSKSDSNLSSKSDPEHHRKRDKVANFFRRMIGRKKKGSQSFSESEIITEGVDKEMIERRDDVDDVYEEPQSNSDSSSRGSESSLNQTSQDATRHAAMLFEDRLALDGNLPIVTLTNGSSIQYPLRITDNDLAASEMNLSTIVVSKNSNEVHAAPPMIAVHEVRPKSNSSTSSKSSSSPVNPWQDIANSSPGKNLNSITSNPWSPELIATNSNAASALHSSAPALQNGIDDDNLSLTSSCSSIPSTCGRVIIVGLSSDFNKRMESFRRRTNQSLVSKTSKKPASEHGYSSDSSTSSISSLESERMPASLKKIKGSNQVKKPARFDDYFVSLNNGVNLDPVYEPKDRLLRDTSLTSNSQHHPETIATNLY